MRVEPVERLARLATQQTFEHAERAWTWGIGLSDIMLVPVVNRVLLNSLVVLLPQLLLVLR